MNPFKDAQDYAARPLHEIDPCVLADLLDQVEVEVEHQSERLAWLANFPVFHVKDTRTPTTTCKR